MGCTELPPASGCSEHITLIQHDSLVFDLDVGFINKPMYGQLTALPAEGSVHLRMRNEHRPYVNHGVWMEKRGRQRRIVTHI